MSSKPVRGCGPRAWPAASGDPPVARSHRSAARGWTLMELLVVVAIIGLMLQDIHAQHSEHPPELPSGRGGLECGRGHPANPLSGRHEWLLLHHRLHRGLDHLSGTNPGHLRHSAGVRHQRRHLAKSCGSWGGPLGHGRRHQRSPSTTLEFGSSGIVGTPPSPATNPLVPCAPNCSFQLSNGNATRTVTISGVGNVKVTSP